MDSLVGYGSDDDNETERFSHHSSVGQGTWSHGGSRRRDDDTNYDDVNMDLSEESEPEPERPPAEHPLRRCPERPERLKRPSAQERPENAERSNSDDSRERNRDRDRDHERRDRRRESPPRSRPDRDRGDRGDREKERRSPRRDRDDRNSRNDRSERSRGSTEGTTTRRGLLGDRPEERSNDVKQVPALMDLKPFGGEPPPGYGRSQDARDAVSPRFVERERRDRDKDRERDRERHSRRSEERRSSSSRHREHRSRSRGAAYPPPQSQPSSSNERRGSPSSNDYRPSSYKVNKKLEVMEKMGLQIKTPDGSMATAQQLRAAASETPANSGLPAYFNPGSLSTNKIMDQVQKRKLLWSNKNKSEAEEAAKWSGTRFAQDSDGKQVSKFMRLMGIKEPAAIKPTAPDATADPNKKQEELFQAMQAQYEVARATTHTMRGVGLGFQRGQF
ncbi:unnamed protein product, partial [Iphiclides podalirius]